VTAIAPAPPAATDDGRAARTPAMVTVRSRGTSWLIDAFEYPGRGAAPRVNVTLEEAQALCLARGARLCTAHEWETSCRGVDGASYPYGNVYDAKACNTDEGAVGPSGAFADCRSHIGAYDMSGNVAEWIAGGAVRGGAVGEGNPAGRCSREGRATGPSATPADRIGFRCCADAPARTAAP
jgi:formylglycine-generating enzyme required for sulfatase activity